jgi:protein deglycase
MARVLIPLLEGFEEIEAVTLIDVLRRAEQEVIVAGDQVGPVPGAHGIAVSAERALAEIVAAELDAIVLPGGMPGARHLAEHEIVQRLLRELAAADKLLAAICAGPIALAAAGVHLGRRLTCYPGFEGRVAGGTIVQDRVVVDGKLVTSRGPGTALEMALTLVGLLAGRDAQEVHGKRMLFRSLA